MRPNVFLRSTLRQPGKVLCLVLVAVLTVFVFVSRASEYLLIKQETDQLAKYYAAIGTLESATGDPWADTREAAAHLEASPYVKTVNSYDCTIGIIQDDICNADLDNRTNTSAGMCFTGTLLDWDERTFYFRAEEVFSGYPEHVGPGRLMAVTWSGNRTNAEATDAAFAALEKGGRYLVRALYYPFRGGRVTYDEAGGVGKTFVSLIGLAEDRFFYPVPEDGEIEWTRAALSGWRDRVREDRDTQHGLNVIAVRDMSALPMLRDTAQGLYLAAGRWLTAEDHRRGTHLCVVNDEFAALRGLEVGDTLTLELRDLPSTFGYFDNCTSLPYNTMMERAKKAAVTYEIAGIYGHLADYSSTFVRNDVYVPASTVPEGFAMSRRDPVRDAGAGPSDYTDLFDWRRAYQSGGGFDSLPRPGTVSFVLTGPEAKAPFLAETREALAKLGFQVSLLENNWERFEAAAGPLRRSALLGTLLFAVILSAALGIIVLAYFRMRRKELPIVRSLGVPAAVCVRQVSAPLLGLGLAGILTGGALGWWYTLQQGAEKLEGLQAFGGAADAALGPEILVALLGGVFALLAALTVGGAVLLFRRPVLVLLQGGTAGRKHYTAPTRYVGSNDPARRSTEYRPSNVRRRTGAAAPYARKRRSPGVAVTLRFAWRQVVRSKLKTALTIALAAGFTAGLAAMELSVQNGRERIDWLYEHTSVEAELNAGQVSIRGGTVEALLDTGTVAEAYLEGSAEAALIRYTPGMEAEEHVSILGGKKMPDQAAVGDDMLGVGLRAVGDEGIFLTPAGSGSRVTITYFDGWDGSLFAEDSGGDFPVILPRELYDEYGGTIALSWKGLHICEAAGIYDGTVDGGGSPVLVPLSAYQRLGGDRVSYSKVHLWLDPALNRDLEPFLRGAEAAEAVQSGLRTVIWDEELRVAVAPLEQSVELTAALYPAALVLALLTAAGTAVLFTLLSAKDAAILRVQGTGKVQTAAVLLLQQLLPCLTGLTLAAAGSLLAGGAVSGAVFYLTAGIAGAAVSAMLLVRKNPMELLQMRE